MKTGWWISTILVFGPAAFADTVKLLPTALEIPDRIGPLVYAGKPDSYSDPRLGMSYRFSAPGINLDIYAYNAGVKDIPDGAASRPVCEQFEQAKADVSRGNYKDFVLKGEQLARMGPTQDPPLAREAVFELVVQDTPGISYVWITGAAGHFIKVRFSINAQLRYELEDARRAVLNAVGTAIQPHLALAPATSPDQKGKDASMVLSSGIATESAIGIPFMVGLATLTSRTDVALPPCGGRFRPSFGAEVSAWQSALRIGKLETKFAKKVAEANSAGYLEEFIWTLHHQDYWGDQPPEGLELAKFDKWSRKHLKDVKVPDFGYVQINRIRELPIEAMQPL